jgi:hypothetical protein
LLRLVHLTLETGENAAAMTKEAAARIKINKLLEAAGWRFFADTRACATCMRRYAQSTARMMPMALRAPVAPLVTA